MTHLTAVIFLYKKNHLAMAGLLAETCWWKYYK